MPLHDVRVVFIAYFEINCFLHFHIHLRLFVTKPGRVSRTEILNIVRLFISITDRVGLTDGIPTDPILSVRPSQSQVRLLINLFYIICPRELKSMSNSIKHKTFFTPPLSVSFLFFGAIFLFPQQLSLNILLAEIRHKQRASQCSLERNIPPLNYEVCPPYFWMILFFFQFIKSPPCVSEDKTYLFGRYYKHYPENTEYVVIQCEADH